MFRRPGGKDSSQSDSSLIPAFSNSHKIQTVIGPGSTLNGTIVAEGGARIDGSFDGNLSVKGPLVIGEGARVVADISAESVSVAGSVKGNITAKRVDIMRTGRIYGDLITGAFTTEEGGFLRGQVRMTDGTTPEEETPIFGARPLATAS
ncbi:MAG: polymer-forming cytoskeletal protein [Chloroflexi bacterium]|nr:polymer-forming cytoskeletal protein [Chloroflexota bacterium]